VLGLRNLFRHEVYASRFAPHTSLQRPSRQALPSVTLHKLLAKQGSLAWRLLRALPEVDDMADLDLLRTLQRCRRSLQPRGLRYLLGKRGLVHPRLHLELRGRLQRIRRRSVHLAGSHEPLEAPHNLVRTLGLGCAFGKVDPVGAQGARQVQRRGVSGRAQTLNGLVLL
jgi:hypothetical protein